MICKLSPKVGKGSEDGSHMFVKNTQQGKIMSYYLLPCRTGTKHSRLRLKRVGIYAFPVPAKKYFG